MCGSMRRWVCILRLLTLLEGDEANMCGVDFGKKMDVNAKDIEKQLEAEFARFGLTKSAKPKDSIFKLLETERYSNKKMPLTEVRKG